MARLELAGIGMELGGRQVLHDVSLTVEEGEFLTVVGPSGCGKSTLLRIAAGLLEPTRGEVRLDGQRVNGWDPLRRDVAMVFQNYALYPHLTVERNLAFPLENRSLPRSAIRTRVSETAALLGLTGLLGRKPAELSGGQMQRVALGRAIVRDPRLFLFDEPLSNLDPRLRGELRAEIAALQRRLGITTLYVTHDQAEALSLGMRVCVLWEGRLEQVGTPREVWEQPASVHVASLLGSPAMNLLRLPLSEGLAELGGLRFPAPDCPGEGEILLGLRPHEILAGGGVAVEVRWSEEQGDRHVVEGDVGGLRLRWLGQGREPPRAGDHLHLRLDAAQRHWFHPRSGRRLRGRGDPEVPAPPGESPASGVDCPLPGLAPP